MNKKLSILMMFLMIQTSNSYLITGNIELGQEILETVNLVKKSYTLLCDVALLYKESETIKTLMFPVSRKDLFNSDLNQGIISKSVSDAFDIFINAIKKLHTITKGNYKILKHDHNGNIDISIKYTKADGSSIWINAERYKQFAIREAEIAWNALDGKLSTEERIARREAAEEERNKSVLNWIWS